MVMITVPAQALILGLTTGMKKMTEYDIRYFDNKHIPLILTVKAKDIPHAIIQFKELMPGMHMRSVLPSEQWSDD